MSLRCSGDFTSPLQESLLKKAQENGLVTITVHNLREWCMDKHKTADDAPYGGGAGNGHETRTVVLAIESINRREIMPRLFYYPQGQVFHQKMAARLSEEKELIFICGRYEGIDERVKDALLWMKKYLLEIMC